MSLKPQPPQPIPTEIAVWGERHLAASAPYKLIGDTLYAQDKVRWYFRVFVPKFWEWLQKNLDRDFDLPRL